MDLLKTVERLPVQIRIELGQKGLAYVGESGRVFGVNCSYEQIKPYIGVTAKLRLTAKLVKSLFSDIKKVWQ